MMRLMAVVLFALLVGCDNQLLDASGFKLKDGRPVDGVFAGAYAIGGVFKPESTAFTTDEFVVLGLEFVDAKDQQHDFEAYVAAPSDGSTSGQLNLLSGALEFNAGWAYLTGMRPMATTSTINAVGDGTRFVLEIIKDSPPDEEYRVYLLPQLGSHSVTITKVSGSGLNEKMMTSGRYVHIKNGAKIADGHITSEQARKDFIEDVRDAVKLQGMDWPAFWP